MQDFIQVIGHSTRGDKRVMELKVDGLTVQVNLSEQSDEWLLNAVQEIASAAQERGIELTSATGAVAVEATVQPEADEVVALPTKESLSEQWSIAYAGYQVTTSLLNEGRHKKDQLPVIEPETLKEELADWLTDEKVAYVAAVQEADPEVHFTLVATPNVVINYKELFKVANTFGKNHTYDETDVFYTFYAWYTPEQLSGTDPSNGKGVIFSLIPTKYSPDMVGTVVEQRSKLAKLQAHTPSLKVPSPLEAVAYRQTLRSADRNSSGIATFDTTYIRHFDLPEQRVFVSLRVPDSHVIGGGEPHLASSLSHHSVRTRISVG